MAIDEIQINVTKRLRSAGVYGANSKKHILRVFLFVDDNDLLGIYLSFLRDATLIWSGEKIIG